MKFSQQVKPISYLKSHAAEIIREMNETGQPLVITQNGEATAVIQDIKTWESQQETFALLKLLAISNSEVQAGKVTSLDEVRLQLIAKRENW